MFHVKRPGRARLSQAVRKTETPPGQARPLRGRRRRRPPARGRPPKTTTRPPGLDEACELGEGQRQRPQGDGRGPGDPSSRRDAAAAPRRGTAGGAGRLSQERPAPGPGLEQRDLEVVPQQGEDEPRRAVPRAHVDQASRARAGARAASTSATSSRTRSRRGPGAGEVDARGSRRPACRGRRPGGPSAAPARPSASRGARCSLAVRRASPAGAPAAAGRHRHAAVERPPPRCRWSRPARPGAPRGRRGARRRSAAPVVRGWPVPAHRLREAARLLGERLVAALPEALAGQAQRAGLERRTVDPLQQVLGRAEDVASPLRARGRTRGRRRCRRTTTASSSSSTSAPTSRPPASATARIVAREPGAGVRRSGGRGLAAGRRRAARRRPRAAPRPGPGSACRPRPPADPGSRTT